MTVRANVCAIAKEARPAIKAWLDASELLAGFRDAASERGIGWSQLKAVLVAEVRDSEDGGHRLSKLAEKADLALTYADMILNENVAEENKHRHNSVPDKMPEREAVALRPEPASEPETDQIQGTAVTAPIDTRYAVPDDLSIPDFLRRVTASAAAE